MERMSARGLRLNLGDASLEGADLSRLPRRELHALLLLLTVPAAHAGLAPHAAECGLVDALLALVHVSKASVDRVAALLSAQCLCYLTESPGVFVFLLVL